MALTTTSCLKNLNPLPKSHSLSPTNTKNQSVSWNNGNEGWWRKRCVLGVAAAGVVVGLQIGDLVVAGETGGGIQMGKVEEIVVAVDDEKKMMKWSEERMCPQWRFNSLETIVPENLPRPFARRRWEAVRLPPTAPRLRATHSTTSPSTRCFFM